MAFGWSEGKSKKNGKIRRKINFVTQGVLTVPKNEVCAILQNRNENFYSVLSNKKQFDRKTQKPKNGDPLKSGQKSAKTSFFAHRAHLRWNDRFLTIFDDFALISKGRRFFVSGSFLSIFFCLKAQNKKFHFYLAESRISQFLMNLEYFTIGS